jgi:hypothetical protein
VLIDGRNRTALSCLPHEQQQGNSCQKQETHNPEHFHKADQGRLLPKHTVKDADATMTRRAPVETPLEKEPPSQPQKLLAPQVAACYMRGQNRLIELGPPHARIAADFAVYCILQQCLANENALDFS